MESEGKFAIKWMTKTKLAPNKALGSGKRKYSKMWQIMMERLTFWRKGGTKFCKGEI